MCNNATHLTEVVVVMVEGVGGREGCNNATHLKEVVVVMIVMVVGEGVGGCKGVKTLQPQTPFSLSVILPQLAANLL